MATKKTPNTPAPTQEQPAPETRPAEVAPKGGVKLRVTTRLERHVRAGIEFRKGDTAVEVSKAQAERLKADPHLKVEPA